MKQLRLLFLVFFLSVSGLNALQVFYTDLTTDGAIVSDIMARDFSSELNEAVVAHDFLRNIRFQYINSTQPVSSLIDGGALAMRESLDYLIFGSVKIRDNWIEAKLSLYERETDSIIAVIYSKSETERSCSLMDEAGRKLVSYIYDRFSIEKRVWEDRSPGYFELSFNPGYWGVFFNPWSEILLGYFHTEISGMVALSEPRFCFQGHEMYPRFGLSVDYGLGGNCTVVESFFYHSFLLSLPFDLSLDLSPRHSLRLGLSPGYQIDYLVQSRKYSDIYSSISGAFVLSTYFTYSFTPSGGNFSMGLINKMDFAFYNEPLITYKPSLSISWKIVRFKEKNIDE